MRTPCIRLLTLFVVAISVAACGKTEAPVGRWEGFSQSPDWVVAVRLQIDRGNIMHATALSVRVTGTDLPERVTLTEKIRQQLDLEWKDAASGAIDFSDNTVFKAGGYAPLFVYDPERHTMTFNFFAGGRQNMRVKLYPVREFLIHG